MAYLTEKQIRWAHGRFDGNPNKAADFYASKLMQCSPDSIARCFRRLGLEVRVRPRRTDVSSKAIDSELNVRRGSLTGGIRRDRF